MIAIPWRLCVGSMMIVPRRLLPEGACRTWCSLYQGLARNEGFIQSGVLQTLRWVRTIGDVVFIIGALAVVWQVCKGVIARGSGQTDEPDALAPIIGKAS